MIGARPVVDPPTPVGARSGSARVESGPADVTLRPWPYPYEAALAICSDLDETPTADDYFDMMRLLNTTETTRLGTGVGLEVGNSIYFDMPPSQFWYWNGDARAREAVRALILSGHVDCLHSFGDLASTRAHAGRALDELARHGCSMKVWVDHAVAPSNFGPDIMRGSGDVEGSPAYHADLTCAFGIEYVWRGRVTSVIGQDVPRRLGGIAQWRHPAASSMTAAKEAAKGWLGRAGSVRYISHRANDLLWTSRLRSGQTVNEFLRANPSWAGISVHETADGLGEVMTGSFLDRLVSRGGGLRALHASGQDVPAWPHACAAGPSGARTSRRHVLIGPPAGHDHQTAAGFLPREAIGVVDGSSDGRGRDEYRSDHHGSRIAVICARWLDSRFKSPIRRGRN